ncbi:hypothetical protein IFM89_021472 [Coptis chinensis]|uniref:Cystatin domain-containing protein n=1 Tax=Coptis chinensis TaxID=261450 RepID=A0A835ITQ4_9MAGN|nr:hypothetical protein IFM89_021472 [Coptis chinensis]
MARAIGLFTLLVFTLLFVSTCSSVLENHAYGGRKVGGWKEIKHVKNNEEVQQLGKFSVEEYNRKKGSDGGVVFAEVIEAQKQVVSGIKYYLKIVVEENGLANSFDAVVVVKPWDRSKELVTFVPSRK